MMPQATQTRKRYLKRGRSSSSDANESNDKSQVREEEQQVALFQLESEKSQQNK
jgi:hypothetical protein